MEGERETGGKEAGVRVAEWDPRRGRRVKCR